MTCPECGGKQRVPALLRLDHGGCEWREIHCLTCHGSGEVDDAYPERRARGERFRRSRIDHDLSVTELARHLAIPAVKLSRFEHGDAELDAAEYERLAACLEVDAP